MIRVLQLIDSLNAGGAERVAVNYANGLTNIIEESHICTTREEGILSKSLNADVGYLFLNRQSIFDISAVLKLRQYVSSNRINIVHAHSTSFFIAVLLKIVKPRIKIVWHDHYGNSEFIQKRPRRILQMSSLFFSYIFCVNSQLKNWSRAQLLCEYVDFIENFPVLSRSNSGLTRLVGIKGKRVLCLANLREQKNHLRLLEAFEIVKNTYQDWTLHCVGKDFGDSYSNLFFSKIRELHLEKNVYFYDSKSDILNIIQQSDIGILVSKSEGLPLSLLEYGLGNLAVISTDVGDCGLLIPDKSYGLLIKNDDQMSIADSIITYIEDKDYRNRSAQKFRKKVAIDYSSESTFKKLFEIYQSIVK